MNVSWAPAYSHWLSLAIVGGLALLTFWLGSLSNTGRPLVDGSFNNAPDYFADAFQATAFADDGAPRYRLSADKMVHFMADDSTALTKPHFIRLDPDLSRVEITAQRGSISAAGEDVYFIGDVDMVQTTPDGQPPLRLRAEYLRVIPDANLMRTEKPVTLVQGSTTVTAGGMEADGARRTLVLSGGVKGVYGSRH